MKEIIVLQLKCTLEVHIFKVCSVYKNSVTQIDPITSNIISNYITVRLGKLFEFHTKYKLYTKIKSKLSQTQNEFTDFVL